MKIRNIFIIAIMEVILLTYNVYAETLTASLNADAVTVGKDIVLTVDVDSESISGIQFDISYDSNVLEYISLNKSEIFDEAYISGINTDNPGNIGVLLGFFEEQNVKGKLLSITFKALGTKGEKNFDVSQIKLMINNEKVIEEDFSVAFKTKGREQASSSGRGGAVSLVMGSTEKDNNVEEDLQKEEKQQESEIIVQEPAVTFSDIDGHWAYDSIMFMANEGIVKGLGDNTFLPDRNITRAEFASLVSDTLNLEEMTDNIYTDVSQDAWYNDVVLKCTQAGLILGYDGKFRPNDLITREEMAIIIFRMANYIDILEQKDGNKVFQDEDDISDWAKEGVTSVVNMGIMNGISENIFGAKRMATRAQGVMVLEKLLRIQWNQI